MKARHSGAFLLAAVFCCVVLVAEGNPARYVQVVGQPEPDDFVPVDEKITKAENDDSEEYRFLTSTGTATASAINNLITREQQALEKLRPTSTSSSSSSIYSTGYGSSSGYTTSGSNVIYLNTGTSTSTSTSSTSGITPTIIYAGRRRRRRPGNRNGNRNRNRNRNGGAQVFLVRPQ